LLRQLGYHAVGTVRIAQKGVVLPSFEKLVFLDLEDTSSLNSLEGDFDAVIHIASVSSGTAQHLMTVNGLGTARLAEWAASHKISSFVHVSSMAVYGNITEPLVTSQTKVAHMNNYGLSKWSAECSLRDISNEMSCVSVRSCAIVGESTDYHFLALVLRRMLAQEPIIRVSNPTFLSNNLVHEDTLSEFLVHLARFHKPRFAAVPIGSSHPMELSEIIIQMSRATGYRGEIEWVASSDTPFGISTADAEGLGFQPLPMQIVINRWIRDALGTDISLSS
jgi:nucleoside-diphosphate-sugar epimerase